MAENGEKRDPSSHRTPTQIRRMDRGYNSRPEMIRRRGLQNQARAVMTRKYGKAALEGKDVDHKKMLDHGGGNDPKNLRIQSERENRGWRRNTRD
jgi:hypothetical protein